MDLVKFSDVSKKLGNSAVLDQINLTMEKGDVFGYIGENGAGKTTTIKILLDLLRPDAGKVELFGESNIDNPELRRKVGFILENSSFDPNLTAAKNLLFYEMAYNDTRPTPEVKEKTEDILKQVRLYEEKDKKVKEYSSGMKQRLELAKLELKDFELLVLDEPTNALDPSGKRWFKTWIQELPQSTTVFVSSHDLSELEDICSKVAVLSQGRIVNSGPIEEVAGEDFVYRLQLEPSGWSGKEEIGFISKVNSLVDWKVKDRELVIKGEGAGVLTDILEKLHVKGIGVEDVVKEKRSLKEVYFEEVEGE